MNSHDLEQWLVALVGYHARTIRRGFSFSEGALFSQVKVCSVCCGPIETEYSQCYSCHERASTFKDELADIVVPLSYAVRGHGILQQFYSDLNQYKFDRPSLAAQERLKALMLLFRLRHQRCLEAAVGQPISAVIAVPSGKNRANHPLPDIAKILSVSPNERRAVPLLPARFVGQPRKERARGTNPDDFAIGCPLSGHVVIVEDTWVQGHNSQGLAVKARRQGADKVSIVVLARMLDYSYPLTKLLVDSWAKDEHFNPAMCPVTGKLH
ncbi:hypothetical protein ACU21_03665 [Actinobaculum suis]|uniref:hypothetical protein n=1 Tax=Actinobaculum suis TaxID=1657 RepID=UPI0008087C47|nr:hypothetical protein [Actinobaculum suis]OCA95608.1 hypothetical protein ACU21_03665 [Actinobaculum suis]